MNSVSRTDFIIISKPDYIHLQCPFCDNEIRIDWLNIDVPECWQDDWGYIECPICEKEIKLGDWDYD